MGMITHGGTQVVTAVGNHYGGGDGKMMITRLTTAKLSRQGAGRLLSCLS